MILSDREILMAVERGVIGVSPLPPWGAKAWTSTALSSSRKSTAPRTQATVACTPSRGRRRRRRRRNAPDAEATTAATGSRHRSPHLTTVQSRPFW